MIRSSRADDTTPSDTAGMIICFRLTIGSSNRA